MGRQSYRSSRAPSHLFIAGLDATCKKRHVTRTSSPRLPLGAGDPSPRPTRGSRASCRERGTLTPLIHSGRKFSMISSGTKRGLAAAAVSALALAGIPALANLGSGRGRRRHERVASAGPARQRRRRRCRRRPQDQGPDDADAANLRAVGTDLVGLRRTTPTRRSSASTTSRPSATVTTADVDGDDGYRRSSPSRIKVDHRRPPAAPRPSRSTTTTTTPAYAVDAGEARVQVPIDRRRGRQPWPSTRPAQTTSARDCRLHSRTSDAD